MPKATVFKGVGGFIVKHCGDYFRVPKELIPKGMTKLDDVAKHLSKHADDIPSWPKGKLRKSYLGGNPTKLGDTGQGIWRKMANADPPQLFNKSGKPLDLSKYSDEAGNLRNLEQSDLKKVFVKDEAGVPRPLTDATMGHMPVDAVDYWTQTGHRMTPEQNKAWMHDPANYVFEYGPDNWRNGSGHSNRYTNADPINGVEIPGSG